MQQMISMQQISSKYLTQADGVHKRPFASTQPAIRLADSGPMLDAY